MKYGPRGLGGQWLMDNALHCKFLFGANYLMNLIRGVCGRGDDRSYASLLTGWIRQENPFRRASPLIASRLKGREAEMDYPEEGEKSAFTPTEQGERFFATYFGSCRFTFVMFEKRAVHLRSMAYRTRIIYRFRYMIFGQYISKACKRTFNIIITKTRKDLSLAD